MIENHQAPFGQKRETPTTGDAKVLRSVIAPT